jgi:tetratricopeptide (TPR) repeat protein
MRPLILFSIGMVVTFRINAWAAVARADVKSADAAFQAGLAASSAGNFTGAAADFEKARDEYIRGGDDEKTARTLIQLAAADEGLGDYADAIAVLQNAPADVSPKLAVEVELAEAQAMILARSDAMGNSLLEPAHRLLLDARKNAADLDDADLLARDSDAQGDFFMSCENARDALAAYRLAFDLSRDEDPALAANAASNAALAAYASTAELSDELNHPIAEQPDKADLERRIAGERLLSQKMNDAAADLVPECPPSRNRLYLKLTIGRTNESLAGLSNPVDSSLIGKAYDFYRQVIDEATISGDTLAAAYGYGLIGHLYEMEGAAGREDAIKATRAAVFRSQQVQDAASLYRWQWQMGRLLDAEGKSDDAISAMFRAIQTLGEAQSEISSGGGNVPTSLGVRDEEGPYRDLADMLLRRARAQRSEKSQTDARAGQ